MLAQRWVKLISSHLMAYKLFTLQEANLLLPQVRRLVLAMQEHAAQLEQLQSALRAQARASGGNGQLTNGKARHYNDSVLRLDTVTASMQALLAEMEALGCELKDIQQGLADFRAERDGRVVYLCWKLGEAEIRFWHELDTGFAGRQPL